MIQRFRTVEKRDGTEQLQVARGTHGDRGAVGDEIVWGEWEDVPRVPEDDE